MAKTEKSVEEISKLTNEIFVTIASNMMSEPVTFKTCAMTLGELKLEMDAKGISYAGQSFQEGNTVTELLNDHTQLPRYKGDKKLDELFIMMTGEKKKITSGIDFASMTRSELVTSASEFLKANPQYKEEFGFPSNQKTIVLVELMNKYVNQTISSTPTTSPAISSQNENNASNSSIIGQLGHAIFSGLANLCANLTPEQDEVILKSSFSPEQIEQFKKILVRK